jgi:hypothetical protein
VIETHHALALLKDCEFDTVYHEHRCYFSLHALTGLLEAHGLAVEDVQRLKSHGGSLRVTACRAPAHAAPAVEELLARERDAGLLEPGAWARFAAAADARIAALDAHLQALAAQGLSLAAYGAAAKGTILLNSLGASAALLAYVVDRAPSKHGRRVPGWTCPCTPSSTWRRYRRTCSCCCPGTWSARSLSNWPALLTGAGGLSSPCHRCAPWVPAVAECCPACGGSAGHSFYGVPALPVHSTRMLATREAALAFPRRPLELVACPHCGFIFNRCFDATLQGYGGDCEESQGCSATFRRWLEALVHRLVEEHGVRGRQVLEIGCGKGEFLAALCRAGANRGIGYDPTHVAGRAGPGEGDLWQVRREFWSVDKGIHGAAFIACRHTLEHIAPVGDFLRELRAAIGSARPLLFFEVPDAGRILAEGAFWDVYYEHCSYFTAASLRGLFLRAGFEVLNLWHDFDDQYLLLLARPAPGGAPGRSRGGGQRPGGTAGAVRCTGDGGPGALVGVPGPVPHPR